MIIDQPNASAESILKNESIRIDLPKTNRRIDLNCEYTDNYERFPKTIKKPQKNSTFQGFWFSKNSLKTFFHPWFVIALAKRNVVTFG